MFNLINQMSFTYNGGVSDFGYDKGSPAHPPNSPRATLVQSRVGWEGGKRPFQSESLFCFVSSDFVV